MSQDTFNNRIIFRVKFNSSQVTDLCFWYTPLSQYMPKAHVYKKCSVPCVSEWKWSKTFSREITTGLRSENRQRKSRSHFLYILKSKQQQQSLLVYITSHDFVCVFNFSCSQIIQFSGPSTASEPCENKIVNNWCLNSKQRQHHGILLLKKWTERWNIFLNRVTHLSERLFSQESPRNAV